MKTDLEITQQAKLIPLDDVFKDYQIQDLMIPWGPYKAKLKAKDLKAPSKGKLVLVTAINPTPAGEGKTTINIGLSMALNKLNKKAISALREPSMGPCFGLKGGATGGGYAQVLPMEDINLHFTGDFHAVTSAHNLLMAMIENHIYHGNTLNIDPHNIVFKHVLDVNDRSLRNIEVSRDGLRKSIPHDSGFDITVASEVMAILCLAKDLDDLRSRLERMVVAYTLDQKEVSAKDIGAVGSMMVLLKDAMMPNLVQTLENTPAIIHGGPFANIAHGCNSLIATQSALKLSEYVITEAGFGADLGAEKFLNIKARQGNLKPDAIVLVATIRALKYNGDQSLKDIKSPSLSHLKKGIVNLTQHLENLRKFKVPIVVTLNKFQSDSKEELDYLKQWGIEYNVRVSISESFISGSEGTLDLARDVIEVCQEPSYFEMLYDELDSLKEKIETVAYEIYRAGSIKYSPLALEKLKTYEKSNPTCSVCFAKTPMSFSDDPKVLGAPQGFELYIRDIKLSKGAEFIVVLTRDVVTMPGLPKKPAALDIDLLNDESIVGLL